MAMATLAATMTAAGLFSLSHPEQNPAISLAQRTLVTKQAHAMLQERTGNQDTIVSQKVGGIPLLTTQELSSILVAAGYSAYEHAITIQNGTPTPTGYALNGLQLAQDTGIALVATKAASYFEAYAPESLASSTILKTVLCVAIRFSLSSMMSCSG